MVPREESHQGFYSGYFMIPKKGGGLCPILKFLRFAYQGSAYEYILDSCTVWLRGQHSVPVVTSNACTGNNEQRGLLFFSLVGEDALLGVDALAHPWLNALEVHTSPAEHHWANTTHSARIQTCTDSDCTVLAGEIEGCGDYRTSVRPALASPVAPTGRYFLLPLTR